MIDTSSESQGKRNFPLRIIYFYLTKDCNLRCRHCWIAPDYQATSTSSAYLPLELFKSIIEEAKPLGLTGVKLTGGEPLLHPQILEILEFIKAEGLTLNIETNGVLCTPEIARAIAACRTMGVSVSLDGIDAFTHEWVRGVDGCFEDAIQGIKNLVAVGVHPQIIMTIMRHNKSQVGEMIEFGRSLGAGSVKFNVVMPTSRGKAMHEAGETLTIEELVAIGDHFEKTVSKTVKIPVMHTHPMAFRPLGNMFSRQGGCAVCNILAIVGVLADGTYALCGIGEALTELTYGNAKTDKLADVWKQAPFLKELRAGLPSRLEGICGNCLLKNMCLGSCIAQNYYRTKSLWAPFWYCEAAQNKGLFPPSRSRRKIY